MSGPPCGAPTRGGAACRFPADRCPHETHARVRGERPAAKAASSPAGAIRERDLRALGWWLIEEILAGRVTPPAASAVNRMMHTLLQLGPTPEADDLALQEVALRGLLMHGVPPRTDAEWRRAAEVFDDEALAEFRRWARAEAEDLAGGVGGTAGEVAGGRVLPP